MGGAGYTAGELRNAGCFLSLQQLKGAGYTAKECKEAGYSLMELRESAYTLQELKWLDYTAEELIREAECTLRELMVECECTPEELQEAGFTARQLKIVQRREAGETFLALMNDGYLISEIQKVGYSW